jgi:hypothetical protein
MLTDEQKKFVELSKKMENLKNELKELSSEVEAVLISIGVGKTFQDPEDGVVFEVTIPTGTYVNFKKIDYERTKRVGESRGTLSMARAKELGFN